jgi:plasmid stability protein
MEVHIRIYMDVWTRLRESPYDPARQFSRQSEGPDLQSIDVLANQQHHSENSSMAVSITIRDVPNETRDILASRAAQSGRSLQEYLSLQLLELAARPDVDSAIASIRERARAYPRIATAEIVAAVNADRR